VSPVSRGRKPKKSKQRAAGRASAGHRQDAYLPPITPQRDALTMLAGLVGDPDQEPPKWFDPAISVVLDGGTASILAAQDPRELDQVVAELLGAELERALHTAGAGLWFEWWLRELADAAASRARDAVLSADRDGWQAPWRLLHALTGLTDPAIGHGGLSRVRKVLPRGAAADEPGWLRLMPRLTATGELWQLRDAYGGRFGVIAGFAYPAGAYRSAYLFDLDFTGFTRLAGGGSFDELAQASEAWRASVGDPAGAARPVPVDDPGGLRCLVEWDGGEYLTGDESRSCLDNWFRARRRGHDLAVVLHKRGTPLPAPQSLYRGREVDAEPLQAGFTSWYEARDGKAPGAEAVAALAYEWVEGTLPGCERVVAPERVGVFVRLMRDWVQDQVTADIRTLLPDWVRWHGEQTGLSPELVDRGVAATVDRGDE
jgi:hypothetical protein